MPSSDDTIRLWNVFTGATIGTFAGHKQPVLSVAFSPDGRTLASSGDDSTVRMWNVATQQELLVDRRLGGALSNLLFSPDGRLLLGSKRNAGRAGGLQVYRAPLLGEIVSAQRDE
jgi:WD40 repeat protein